MNKILLPCVPPFHPYPWLNFERLTESKGYRMEIYFDDTEGLSAYSHWADFLFGNYYDQTRILPFAPGSVWGDYCIDNWDIERDEYDYSLIGKSPSTAKFLSILEANEISAELDRFALTCSDFAQFLPVAIECVLEGTAIYSLMFYVPEHEFVFYFHRSGSFGFYYKDLNAEIIRITSKIGTAGLRITRSNDLRINEIANS